MPELPEVESIARTLSPWLENHALMRLPHAHPQVYQGLPGSLDAQSWVGINHIKRRGKYLLIQRQDGLIWNLHLRMTGRLTVVPLEQDAFPLHTHVVWQIGKPQSDPFKEPTPEAWLIFQDPRRFGHVRLEDPQRPETATLGYLRLGVEPLGAEFSPDCFLQGKKHYPKRMLKAFLLDQQQIAGLGNIYADEICFAAKIRPTRRLARLTRPMAIRLFEETRRVLSAAIAARGTTFRDYRDGLGQTGEFAKALFVYGRAGMPCRLCQTPLKKTVVAGRTTVFCPCCQRS